MHRADVIPPHEADAWFWKARRVALLLERGNRRRRPTVSAGVRSDLPTPSPVFSPAMVPPGPAPTPTPTPFAPALFPSGGAPGDVEKPGVKPRAIPLPVPFAVPLPPELTFSTPRKRSPVVWARMPVPRFVRRGRGRTGDYPASDFGYLAVPVPPFNPSSTTPRGGGTSTAVWGLSPVKTWRVRRAGRADIAGLLVLVALLVGLAPALARRPGPAPAPVLATVASEWAAAPATIYPSASQADPFAIRPPAPLGLTVTHAPVGPGRVGGVVLSWGPVSDAGGYTLQRLTWSREPSPRWADVRTWEVPGENNTTSIDTPPDGTHVYRVRAWRQKEIAPWPSAPAPASTQAPSPAPAPTPAPPAPPNR
jgi:hypothetical protein